MTPVDVLKLIILNDGNCSSLKTHHCKVCPLGELKKREDGRYMNCIEALSVEEMTEAEADARYLETAKSKMLDIQIETVLEEDIEPEQQG